MSLPFRIIIAGQLPLRRSKIGSNSRGEVILDMCRHTGHAAGRCTSPPKRNGTNSGGSDISMTSRTRSYPQILTVLVGVTHPDDQRADAALGAPTHRLGRERRRGSATGDGRARVSIWAPSVAHGDVLSLWGRPNPTPWPPSARRAAGTTTMPKRPKRPKQWAETAHRTRHVRARG